MVTSLLPLSLVYLASFLTFPCVDATMSSNTRIIELANIISSSTAQIQEILDSQGIPPLSFDEEAPVIPSSIADAQNVVLDATAELNDLLTDPYDRLHRLTLNDEAAVLKTIATFDIANLVPARGQISFAEIASKTPLTEQMAAHIIRHAATFHVFHEPRPGFAAHTQASKMLANVNMTVWVIAGVEESTPAFIKLPEALAKWPRSQEFNETGYTIANGMSFSEVMAQYPERAKNLAIVQDLQMSRPPLDTKYGIQAYDWASLGQARVVDIGGGTGRFALPLARAFPNLHVVVQDSPQAIEHANAGDLADRVQFEPYDYFSPQTVQADVFSFRQFFHVWSDKYAIAVLKAQVPALRPGTRFIVQQKLLPEPGSVPRWKERALRGMDIEFAAFANAGERTLIDWKALFAAADPGFQYEKFTEPEGSDLAVLEFVWQGASSD